MGEYPPINVARSRRRRPRPRAAVGHAQMLRPVPAQASSRSSRLRTLPFGSRGSSSTRSIRLGTLYGSSRSRHHASQLVGADGRACLDHRDGVLAVAIVGHTEHRAVDDRRVPVQHLLDLPRVDVHAGADDHVAQPVGEVQPAVVVEVADVADGERAVAPGVGRLRRVVVVLEPAVRRRDPDQPVLSRRPARRPSRDHGCAPATPGHGSPTVPGRSNHSAGDTLRRAALAHAVQLPHLGARAAPR